MIPSCSFFRQRGAAMVEFAVVGPVLTLLGLATIQYSLLFFAKNHLNHATFMAARAGTMENAKMDAIKGAFTRALIPIHGGGSNQEELAESYARAEVDVAEYAQIEILNPTKESFDAFPGEEKDGKRTIPNTHLFKKNPNDINTTAGQNIQDANLLKLRITYGFEPKIPLMGLIYKKYLQWLDTGDLAFNTALINAGRIPVVSHVTVLMQSDAIESDAIVSSPHPGEGNNGSPTNPGDPPTTDKPPPECATIGCTVEPGGSGSSGGSSGGGSSGGGSSSGGDVCETTSSGASSGGSTSSGSN